MKYGDPKCRFMANDGTTVYTDGEFIYYPLQNAAASDGDKRIPNSIHCSTPVWQLHNGFTAEQVKLDVTINGQNFAGNFDFNFTEILEIHRVVPMAGPISGNKKTKLIGTGYHANHVSLYHKWGVYKTESIVKQDVIDYVYEEQSYLNMIEGSQELKAYWFESTNFPKRDTTMIAQQTYNSVY